MDETLRVNKFENADFKYGISFLKFQPKIPSYGNFGRKFKDFFLDEILCWEKFEGADVKYHSTVVFSSSSPENTQIRQIWF